MKNSYWAIGEVLFYVLVGALLLFAAIQKSLLLVEPAWVFANTSTTYLANSLIALTECVVGSFLISGLFRKQMQYVCAAMFFAFSYYQAYLVMSDVKTCGCLGAVEFPPSLMLVLDVTICLFFFVLLNSPGTHRSVSRKLGTALLVCLVLPTTFFVSTHAMGGSRAKQVVEVDGIEVVTTTDGTRLSVLQPEKWLNKDFPLDAHFASPVEFHSGIVVLVEKSCARCEELVDWLNRAESSSLPFLVVYLDGPPSSVERTPSGDIVGLSGQLKWVCKTPIGLEVKNGFVVRLLDEAEVKSSLSN